MLQERCERDTEAFVDGRLEGSSLSQFNDHLDGCSPCQERVAELMELEKALAGHFTPPPPRLRQSLERLAPELIEEIAAWQGEGRAIGLRAALTFPADILRRILEACWPGGSSCAGCGKPPGSRLAACGSCRVTEMRRARFQASRTRPLAWAWLAVVLMVPGSILWNGGHGTQEPSRPPDRIAAPPPLPGLPPREGPWGPLPPVPNAPPFRPSMKSPPQPGMARVPPGPPEGFPGRPLQPGGYHPLGSPPATGTRTVLSMPADGGRRLGDRFHGQLLWSSSLPPEVDIDQVVVVRNPGQHWGISADTLWWMGPTEAASSPEGGPARAFGDPRWGFRYEPRMTRAAILQECGIPEVAGDRLAGLVHDAAGDRLVISGTTGWIVAAPVPRPGASGAGGWTVVARIANSLLGPLFEIATPEGRMLAVMDSRSRCLWKLPPGGEPLKHCDLPREIVEGLETPGLRTVEIEKDSIWITLPATSEMRSEPVPPGLQPKVCHEVDAGSGQVRGSRRILF